MCRLAFHEALCLAFAVEKFTEHQLPQSGMPFLPSPIRADGQPQLVADVLKDLWGKYVTRLYH